ncbi:hypothetical protein NIES21_26690 [Anabaenopsis circularis NIES-21]|uniref:DUF4870 domain-containing protein n=2 Tax=Nostocales TaxID=1161 RepID=A0A1Z4GH79_9CYAN|nr:hypothetical protein [Nostoc cycadae]BAY16835.1 hypothetical protein NIES21_26690 [Anabaenopsis circularis NIES-21]GBE91823.1 membrane protein [Nostoc cycadae WK-1]
MENLEPINDSFGVEAENQPVSPQVFSQNSYTNQRQLLIYVIPVIGVLPSLWTLYRHQGSREQLRVSRQSVTMTFTWLLTYLLLATGAASSEFLALRLLILNSLITSGYFLVSIWLIFRIIRGQSSRLPGLSNLAERVLGKHLS